MAVAIRLRTANDAPLNWCPAIDVYFSEEPSDPSTDHYGTPGAGGHPEDCPR